MEKTIPTIIYCSCNLAYFNNVRTKVKALFSHSY